MRKNHPEQSPPPWILPDQTEGWASGWWSFKETSFTPFPAQLFPVGLEGQQRQQGRIFSPSVQKQMRQLVDSVWSLYLSHINLTVRLRSQCTPPMASRLTQQSPFATHHIWSELIWSETPQPNPISSSARALPAPQPANFNDLQLNKSLPHALGLPAHAPCEAVALISPFSQQQT